MTATSSTSGTSTLTILIALLLLVSLASPALSQQSFAERKDSVLSFSRTTDVGVNYPAAMIRVLAPDKREEGLAMLGQLTSNVSPNMIERYLMIAAYVHLHTLLPDSMRQRIEFICGNYPVLAFESEHEKVAYYATLYLMTQLGSESAVFFNGRSRKENEEDARGFLLHWMREVTEQGQREFDSPTYAPILFVSMLMLRDFATDEDMRRRGELMAQWLLADYAHDYLAGSYCGAHGREHMLSAMNPITSDMTGIGWLYFGDGPRVYGREQLLAALSDFAPHPAIVEVATHRETAFESWERKRCAEIYRDRTGIGGKRLSEDVVRYTYMDPLYGMGSIPGGLVQPREQHSWDVTWIGRNPEKPATLFLMHPYADAKSLTPFMPHGAEITQRRIGILDPYFPTVTKTVGGSPYEDVFQYKNTLIALYDIGDSVRFPLTVGFFPPETENFDVDSLRTHWITINTGDVYIAVYPLTDFRLVDGTFGKHSISGFRRSGAIVQALGRNVAGSYEQFRKKIRATKVDTSRFATDRLIRYTTINGDVLEFAFDGKRTVNGKTVGMKKDLLFDSPLLQSKLGSGQLTIKRKKGNVVIDMRSLEIREE
jgi:hypothetical protein